MLLLPHLQMVSGSRVLGVDPPDGHKAIGIFFYAMGGVTVVPAEEYRLHKYGFLHPVGVHQLAHLLSGAVLWRVGGL